MQSIRSRLMVFQVVQAIRTQSSITFDFVVLVTLARFEIFNFLIFFNRLVLLQYFSFSWFIGK